MDAAATDRSEKLLALYEQALPEVYGYLLRRCGEIAVAEDLTSEVFLAAAHMTRDGSSLDPTVAWLVTVARNKLVDYWRRRTREERGLRSVRAELPVSEPASFAQIDEGRAVETLRHLPAHYQAALTLRYLDGLSVPEVATELGKTLHATESLLARARATFRRLYPEEDDD